MERTVWIELVGYDGQTQFEIKVNKAEYVFLNKLCKITEVVSTADTMPLIAVYDEKPEYGWSGELITPARLAEIL